VQSLLHNLARLHFSEQNLTSSQHRAHFLRQVKGRLHLAQIFWGRLLLRIDRRKYVGKKYILEKERQQNLNTA
jgi:hypothetical protein